LIVNILARFLESC